MAARGPAVGDRVQAFYGAESGYFDAVVVAADDASVRVRWCGYGTEEAVQTTAVRPPPPLPAGWTLCGNQPLVSRTRNMHHDVLLPHRLDRDLGNR